MLRIDYNILFEIVNVLILFYLMKRFLFKPVKSILAQRKAEIDQSFADADQATQEANALRDSYEEQMKGVEGAKEEALLTAKKEAAKEYDRIVGEARKQSEIIISDARVKARAAANEEKAKAADEIAALVKKAAAKIAESESDEKLYDDFLQEVGRSNDAARDDFLHKKSDAASSGNES